MKPFGCSTDLGLPTGAPGQEATFPNPGDQLLGCFTLMPGPMGETSQQETFPIR